MNGSFHLDVFFGEATSAEARVYAQLSGDSLQGLELSGVIRGPLCRYASTLPTDVRFRAATPGQTPLATAIVPDPCFWSAESPYCYEVTIEVKGQTFEHTFNHLYGIRPLAGSGSKLFLAGKRFVPRGLVVTASPALDELAAWHQAGAVMLVRDPSDALCGEASRLGVMVLADLTHVSLENTVAELRRLARWPAVAAAMIEHEQGAQLADEAPRNLLLAQFCSLEESGQPEPWARVLICDVDSPAALAERTADCALPVIAFRRGDESASLLERRAACDRLQADLAKFGDWAGYIV